MAVRIVLFDAPDYYTNLDTIRGEVRFQLTRPERIGTIVVKLEGESSTSLTVPPPGDEKGWVYKTKELGDLDPVKTPGATTRPVPGTVFKESHKVLYQVMQVYPPPNEHLPRNGLLPAAEYTFPFHFKIPINNVCADPVQLARSGGVVDSSCHPESPAMKLVLFGPSSHGIRFMDGAKQLQYHHVKQTLPPSFDGFLSSTESTDIRYFIKATIQRPNILKGNWRNSFDFRFLPIEPLREPPSTREVFARRPFTFRKRSEQTEAPPLVFIKRKGPFFRATSGSMPSLPDSHVSPASPSSSPDQPPLPLQNEPTTASTDNDNLAPSVLITAFLPHKPVLTCNEAISLRMVAQKMAPSREKVYMTSLEIRLTGSTRVRSKGLEQTKMTKWIVASSSSLSILVSDPDAPVDSEISIPDHIWRDKVLPDTVMPSFMTCNVSRSYQLEIRVGLSWSLDGSLPSSLDVATPIMGGKVQSKREQKATQKAIKSAKAKPAHLLPQTIILPLEFDAVSVYSGIKLNPALVDAAHQHRQRISMLQQPQLQQQQQQCQNTNRPQPQPQLLDSHPIQPHAQLLDSHPITQNRPNPPHIDTRGPPLGPQSAQQTMNQNPNVHAIQGEYRQTNPYPNQMSSERRPIPQRPQHMPEQPIFELPSEPVPSQPPPPDHQASPSPISPTDPDISPVSPTVSEAVQMTGTPVIRRRPVPEQFAQRQREEQRRRENPEKFPSGEYPSSGTSFGQVHESVHCHGPQHHYHMHQQQTEVSPLYTPQLQPGEDPRGASAEIAAAPQGTVLVSYNGVVSAMVQDVASAIDAFAFADSDTASIYQEAPPSYDEAMAETITAVAQEGDYHAQRPAFHRRPLGTL